MKKLNISFRIKSEDSSQDFKTKGELKNNRMKFIDPDKNTNYIIFKSDIIEYYKKGEADMKFIFDLHDLTKGTYVVMGNKLLFDIHTKKIEKSDGLLEIKYDLFQQGELVNNTTLRMTYEVIEEE